MRGPDRGTPAVRPGLHNPPDTVPVAGHGQPSRPLSVGFSQWRFDIVLALRASSPTSELERCPFDAHSCGPASSTAPRLRLYRSIRNAPTREPGISCVI